jgi:hypothetical protein
MISFSTPSMELCTSSGDSSVLAVVLGSDENSWWLCGRNRCTPLREEEEEVPHEALDGGALGSGKPLEVALEW